MTVARLIRKLRERRGLSQQSLAVASGLSRNTLSLLERGQTSPTITTLQKLADALNVGISAFFLEPPRQNSIDFAAKARMQSLSSEGTLSSPGPCRIGRLMTALIMVLEPGAASGPSQAHSGRKFIYCLSGQFNCFVDDQTFLLEPGDSLNFDGSLTHSCQNTGRKISEALVVMSMPEDGTEYTTEGITKENLLLD